MQDRLSKTQTSGFGRSQHQSDRGAADERQPQPTRPRFRLRNGSAQHQFDPVNPFTYWMKGTDACNEDFETEKELKRQKIQSATHEGRKIPYYERLSKDNKLYTREGYFRKLKNELSKHVVNLKGQLEYDITKEEVIRNNLLDFEKKVEEKNTEVDFNAMVFKAKRIPVKKYIEYKREIRLSKLKQVDIIANINDMKNLIVKAGEELEENIGTEKKSMEEINTAVQESRATLENIKKRQIELTKQENELVQEINNKNNKKAHLSNYTSEANSKKVLLQKNRDFLIRMLGLENMDQAMMQQQLEIFASQQVESEDLDKYPVIDLENLDDNTFMTQPTKDKQALHLKNGLTELEAKNPLLSQLKSPLEFLDRLRRVDNDNLDYMQQFQNIMEEITDIDNKAAKVEEEGIRKKQELQENIARLHETKRALERTIQEKNNMIEITKHLKPKQDPSKQAPVQKSSTLNSKKELKDPREVTYTTAENIDRIFNENCVEELQKEYKGQGILKQLLCIERSLKLYIDAMREFNMKLYEDKKSGKRSNDILKIEQLEEKMNDRKSERQKEIESYEKAKKDEKEANMLNRINKKKSRKDQTRTFLPEKKVAPKVDKEDEMRKLYIKYFTDNPTN